MLRGFFAVILFCTFAGAAPLRADIKAVLVGVSDYDETIGLADLRGPANDIRLLQAVLRDRGVTDIVVLADGVAGGVRPTRAAILAALRDAAQTARADDFVYVHLSGHGTQQADPQGDESDGLDEVFLPADTARADPGAGVIPNAIVDDEIGAAVDAIRATGADVWLVLDSCHSGSGLRAASPRAAARFVDPQTLGITATRSAVAEAGAVDHAAPDLPGRYLAFYAARSNELAREVDLAPEGATEPQWYGLFTAKLAARLQQEAAPSFRQLFQAVLRDMNDASVPGGARLQTPSWEGDLIDAALFSGERAEGRRRFSVRGDQLSAGLLHGLGNGSLVALYANPADPEEARLGFAQVEDAEATLAFLRPVAADCQPAAGAFCARAGALPPQARFAQLAARPVDLRIAIAPPVDLLTGERLGSAHPAAAGLAAGIAQGGSAVAGFELALDPDSYEIETVWDGHALWFGYRASLGAQPMGLSWVPEAEPLAPLLERIGRAETLARMLGALVGGGSILNPNPVALTADYRPTRIDDLAPVGAGVSPVRECRAALANVMGKPAERLEQRASLKQCDQVYFGAQGTTAGARDVNRIHIDAQFCIHAEYARIEGSTAPHPLGPEMTICSDCPGGYSAGEERVFLVVTENAENAEALNLEGLVENCGAAAGGTRGTAQRQTMSFLGRIARRPDTRGSFGAVGISDIWVEETGWTVLPREQAFARAGH